MRTIALVMISAALTAGCSKKSSEEASPSAPVAAAAPAPAPSAVAAASDSIAPLASAAPAPSAAAPNVPTEEQYEQKAQTAISSTASAEAELKKLEQEIGQ